MSCMDEWFVLGSWYPTKSKFWMTAPTLTPYGPAGYTAGWFATSPVVSENAGGGVLSVPVVAGGALLEHAIPPTATAPNASQLRTASLLMMSPVTECCRGWAILPVPAGPVKRGRPPCRRQGRGSSCPTPRLRPPLLLV